MRELCHTNLKEKGDAACVLCGSTTCSEMVWSHPLPAIDVDTFFSLHADVRRAREEAYVSRGGGSGGGGGGGNRLFSARRSPYDAVSSARGGSRAASSPYSATAPQPRKLERLSRSAPDLRGKTAPVVLRGRGGVGGGCLVEEDAGVAAVAFCAEEEVSLLAEARLSLARGQAMERRLLARERTLARRERDVQRRETVARLDLDSARAAEAACEQRCAEARRERARANELKERAREPPTPRWVPLYKTPPRVLWEGGANKVSRGERAKRESVRVRGTRALRRRI